MNNNYLLILVNYVKMKTLISLMKLNKNFPQKNKILNMKINNKKFIFYLAHFEDLYNKKIEWNIIEVFGRIIYDEITIIKYCKYFTSKIWNLINYFLILQTKKIEPHYYKLLLLKYNKSHLIKKLNKKIKFNELLEILISDINIEIKFIKIYQFLIYSYQKMQKVKSSTTKYYLYIDKNRKLVSILHFLELLSIEDSFNYFIYDENISKDIIGYLLFRIDNYKKELIEIIYLMINQCRINTKFIVKILKSLDITENDKEKIIKYINEKYYAFNRKEIRNFINKIDKF